MLEVIPGLKAFVEQVLAHIQEITHPMPLDRRHVRLIALVLGTAGVVLWAYWSTLVEVAERWANDPQYSHGFLVPLFAAYLLWSRRGHLTVGSLRPAWWGAGIVVLGAVMRLASSLFYQPWLDTGSLLVCLAGLAAAFGGRRALVWAGPSILFLLFMLPLPYRVERILGGNLQRIATNASAYALQTLGVSAVTEGNVILLSNTRMGVVEACNGLSMLFTFFALATAVAVLSHKSLPEKIAIFLSAVPIAILANVARITVTGLLFEGSRDELARTVFHDLAGWLMMPLALGMLLLELFVLGQSVVRLGDAAPNRPSRPGRVVSAVG